MSSGSDWVVDGEKMVAIWFGQWQNNKTPSLGGWTSSFPTKKLTSSLA
jgi:hypothetical protein